MDGRASKRCKLWLGCLFGALVLLAFQAPAANAAPGDTVADNELGQPDFAHSKPNTVDPEALDSPQRVAIDKSVVPNRIYVSDSANSRVLGYRSVAALVNGASADLVIGQPDLFASDCDNGGVTAKSLCRPGGVAVDHAGNLFIADRIDNRVLEYNNPFASFIKTGMNADFSANLVFGQTGFTTAACNRGLAAPGAATLCEPTGVAVDTTGNLYVADQNNNRVLEYNTPLAVTAVPGSGDTVADHVFGQLGNFLTRTANNGGVSANSLSFPGDVAVDAADNLYVADQTNNRVLKYNTPLTAAAAPGSGDTTADMVFGQAGSFNARDCVSSASGLCVAIAVNVDHNGDVFITDTGRVLEYQPPIASAPVAGRIFGQAGDFTSVVCNVFVEFGSSPATVCNPAGLAVDSSNDLYVADQGNNRVIRFSSPFDEVPVANLALGQPDLYHNSPNTVDFSGLFNPSGVAVDQNSVPNHLYVADSNNNRVLGYEDAASFLNGAPADIVIGQPDLFSSLCDGLGTPDERLLCVPQAVAVDQNGNLFVADSSNNRTLEYPSPFESGYVASEPAITVFGQDGSFVSRSCNPTSGASQCSPQGVAFDKVHGVMWMADRLNNRVLGYTQPFALSPSVNIVIGQADLTGNQCNRRSGAPPARNTLCFPQDTAVDNAGNLFVADTHNHRVLEFNFPLASGANAARVFGQGGSFTSQSCNKTGINANGLCNPEGVTVDVTGNVYIDDTFNNRVLEYNTPLKVTKIGGSGDTTADKVFGQANDFSKGGCNQGLSTPSNDGLCEPSRVASDKQGSLYVADLSNNRVLRYDQPMLSTPAATATARPTSTATPNPGTPIITGIPAVIEVGGSFSIDGSGFSAVPVVNFFVATSAGPINDGPLTPIAKSATQLTVSVPVTVSLGQGFVSVQVINTDKGFLGSNQAAALLQGFPAAGIPSLTKINGVGLAPTSSDPAFATNNIETVVVQGAAVKLGGIGFDATHGVAVDLFCACPGGKVGPFFLKPGDHGLTPSVISLVLPATGSEAPTTGPGSFVVSNAGKDGSYSKKSNAVSVPIGAQITVNSVHQSASTVTVDGAGFSTLTVLNFFNQQGGVAVNLGGLTSHGTVEIPLTFVNENTISFTVPTSAIAGPSYVQMLNPPFVPFSSSGNASGGAFMLK